MAESKFRAWDKVNRKMWYGYFFIDADGELWRDQDPHGVDMSGKRKIARVSKENYSILQFTRLKDKNGKEIYAGDLLRYPNPDIIVEVREGIYSYEDEYTMEGNGFYLANGMSVFRECSRSWTIATEIIGNIYETPELIQCQQSTPA